MTEGIIPDFAELSALKQKAVTLKSQGHTHASIARQLRTKFHTSTTKKTVDSWFERGGQLWQAYMSFNEQLADQAVIEANQLVRVYAGDAVQTLHELSKPPHPATIRVNASRALANVLLRNPEVAAVKQSPTKIDQEIAEIIDSAQSKE